MLVCVECGECRCVWSVVSVGVCAVVSVGVCGVW